MNGCKTLSGALIEVNLLLLLSSSLNYGVDVSGARTPNIISFQSSWAKRMRQRHEMFTRHQCHEFSRKFIAYMMGVIFVVIVVKMLTRTRSKFKYVFFSSAKRYVLRLNSTLAELKVVDTRKRERKRREKNGLSFLPFVESIVFTPKG